MRHKGASGNAGETAVQLQHALQDLHLAAAPGLQGRAAARQQQAVPDRSPAVIAESTKHVQAAFGDLLALPPSALILPIGGGGDREQEAKMWDCFADVYQQELQHQLQQHQQQQQGSRSEDILELPKEKRRQILADILVWAEITQTHYDSSTASFVTGPHECDASFQRIGRLFKAAKKQRGLA